MLYWQFWDSYWKNLADIASGDSAGAKTVSLHPAKNKPAEIPPPHEKSEYLSEFGTQILSVLTLGKGCIYLSRNFERLTGYRRLPKLGERFYDLIHADFHDRLSEHLAGAEIGKPIPFRCKMRHADEKYYWYQFMIHPRREADIMEYVCVLENINDSMQVQNTLQKARLEAELALRARSEFLANMSHDLRTPLNAVIGFSQIIESEIFGKIESPQYMDYVHHIQESGYDLLSKIEDLLEISNIDAGRVTLEREEITLGDVLKHVIETQLHHASASNITFEYRPLEGDVMLYVDRLKLQHILGHLLSNAIRFSHKDGRVYIESSLAETGGLNLVVRDEGIGMSKAKLEHITSALSEDDCWMAKSSHGLGLGLTLTKEFVSLHGGTVTIESKAGAGTSIHLALPANCMRAERFAAPARLRQAAR